jgi:hypothetical protein
VIWLLAYIAVGLIVGAAISRLVFLEHQVGSPDAGDILLLGFAAVCAAAIWPFALLMVGVGWAVTR